jgi:hypothetical protein
LVWCFRKGCSGGGEYGNSKTQFFELRCPLFTDFLSLKGFDPLAD